MCSGSSRYPDEWSALESVWPDPPLRPGPLPWRPWPAIRGRGPVRPAAGRTIRTGRSPRPPRRPWDPSRRRRRTCPASIPPTSSRPPTIPRHVPDPNSRRSPPPFPGHRAGRGRRGRVPVPGPGARPPTGSRSDRTGRPRRPVRVRLVVLVGTGQGRAIGAPRVEVLHRPRPELPAPGPQPGRQPLPRPHRAAHNRVVLRDLGSSNGTILGDRRLKQNEEVEVADGQRLQVGPMQFRFAIEPVAAPPATRAPEPRPASAPAVSEATDPAHEEPHAPPHPFILCPKCGTEGWVPMERLLREFVRELERAWPGRARRPRTAAGTRPAGHGPRRSGGRRAADDPGPPRSITPTSGAMTAPRARGGAAHAPAPSEVPKEEEDLAGQAAGRPLERPRLRAAGAAEPPGAQGPRCPARSPGAHRDDPARSRRPMPAAGEGAVEPLGAPALPAARRPARPGAHLPRLHGADLSWIQPARPPLVVRGVPVAVVPAPQRGVDRRRGPHDPPAAAGLWSPVRYHREKADRLGRLFERWKTIPRPARISHGGGRRRDVPRPGPLGNAGSSSISRRAVPGGGHYAMVPDR